MEVPGKRRIFGFSYRSLQRIGIRRVSKVLTAGQVGSILQKFTESVLSANSVYLFSGTGCLEKDVTMKKYIAGFLGVLAIVSIQFQSAHSAETRNTSGYLSDDYCRCEVYGTIWVDPGYHVQLPTPRGSLIFYTKSDCQDVLGYLVYLGVCRANGN